MRCTDLPSRISSVPPSSVAHGRRAPGPHVSLRQEVRQGELDGRLRSRWLVPGVVTGTSHSEAGSLGTVPQQLVRQTAMAFGVPGKQEIASNRLKRMHWSSRLGRNEFLKITAVLSLPVWPAEEQLLQPHRACGGVTS